METNWRWEFCEISELNLFRGFSSSCKKNINPAPNACLRPHLWSSGQSFWLQIQRSRVRFPALQDFLSSSGSGTESTQPREVN